MEAPYVRNASRLGAEKRTSDMCDEDEDEDDDAGMWRHEYTKWGGYVCAKITCEERLIGYHFEKKGGEAFFMVADGATIGELKKYEKSLLKKGFDFEMVHGGIAEFWEFIDGTRDKLEPLFVAAAEQLVPRPQRHSGG